MTRFSLSLYATFIRTLNLLFNSGEEKKESTAEYSFEKKRNILEQLLVIEKLLGRHTINERFRISEKCQMPETE